MNDKITISWVCTKNLDLASVLLRLGSKIDSRFGIIKEENGMARFYFDPSKRDDGLNVKQLIDDWNKTDLPVSHILTPYKELFQNRNELLDFVKKAKPPIQISHGKYTIIASPNVSEEIKREALAFFDKGGNEE